MGLSATQMRFLMVTARKSNVEYQGQQINQARTALANQSSDLFTQLMSLKAPTAPSVYQFVIEPPLLPEVDWADPSAYPLSEDAQENFMIYYAGNEPQFKNFNIPEYQAIEEKDEDGKVIGISGFRKYLGVDKKGIKQYSEKVYTQEDLKDKTFCYKTTGQNSAGEAIKYTKLSIAEDAAYTYDIETGTFNAETGNDNSSLPRWLQAYNLAATQYSMYSQPSKKAIYKQDADISDKDEMPDPEAYSNSEKINANQAQYDAAMAQYKLDLEEYEKACDLINAKTEEIHEADKRLELQLKQLDTEQEAITQEWEALSKVLNKNIETTFKTFG